MTQLEPNHDDPTAAPGGGPDSSAREVSSSRRSSYTVPSMTLDDGALVSDLLQARLVALLDLGLTLKHIHWNVVGANFIAVHEMLDPQHAGVQAMVDDLAERVATLGGVPSGLPGRIVSERDWDDYELARADALSHLGALDLVYQGVIESHREAIDRAGEVDPVSEDLLIGQAGTLERYHWFVRSHLEDHAGGMANTGGTTEMAAARAVAAKQRRRRTPSAVAR